MVGGGSEVAGVTRCSVGGGGGGEVVLPFRVWIGGAWPETMWKGGVDGGWDCWFLFAGGGF